MKAVRLKHPSDYEALAITDESIPVLGERDVLIRVHAASLNFRDTIIAKGGYPSPLADNPMLLSDGAGEVAEVGSEVTRTKAGDRVAAHCVCDWIGGPVLPEYRANSLGTTRDGMLAEYVRVHERAIVLLPDHLSYVEAASLPCAAVSEWSALHVFEPLAPGQTVLIQGTGGVSLFGLQLARAFGARVIALTSTDEKAQRLLSMGADAVVNYREVPDWENPVFELTDGRGVDKVVEIGGSGTINHAVTCTRHGGELGLVGYVTGFAGGVPPVSIQVRALPLKAVSIGPRMSFEALLRAMAVSKTRPVIDSVFPFTEFREGLRYLDSGQHFGKVVVDLTA